MSNITCGASSYVIWIWIRQMRQKLPMVYSCGRFGINWHLTKYWCITVKKTEYSKTGRFQICTKHQWPPEVWTCTWIYRGHFLMAPSTVNNSSVGEKLPRQITFWSESKGCALNNLSNHQWTYFTVPENTLNSFKDQNGMGYFWGRNIRIWWICKCGNQYFPQ